MAGKPGRSGGWNRKQPEMRLGHSNRDNPAPKPHGAETRPVGPAAPQPKGRSDWHPMAAAWWKALGLSDIAKIAQPADWCLGYVAADVLDQLYTNTNGFTASLLKEWHTIAATLHSPRLDLLGAEPVAVPDVDLDDLEAEDGLDDDIARLRLIEGNGQ